MSKKSYKRKLAVHGRRKIYLGTETYQRNNVIVKIVRETYKSTQIRSRLKEIVWCLKQDIEYLR